MEREKLGSRLGFILLSAGCAIGVGNVWKFPYITGQNGGGAFVVVYLLCLLLLGLPVMIVEFTLGRAAQVSPALLFRKLTPKKKVWNTHGYLSLAANVVLLMFYSVVTGWIVKYCFKFAKGDFVNMKPDDIGQSFDSMLGEPGSMILFTVIVLIFAAIVCSFSLQKGLEKISKILMSALLILLVVLAVKAVTLDGAGEGIRYYLLPDFSKINSTVIVAAMNQAFFTLSLGIGSMAIFGSYIGKERSMFGEAVTIIVLDTFVAIVAGLIIFPTCFTYGVAADAGPSLLFITLPNVFANMSLGRFWGTLFFVFMSFAALSTVLAVFECIVANVRELTGWEKKKASIGCGLALIVLSIPCALGFNVWSGFHPFGLEGKNIMDLEDFFVSNLMLPIGSIVYCLYATKSWGWGFDNFLEEANAGKGYKIKKWTKYYLGYVIPAICSVILVIGLIDYFKG